MTLLPSAILDAAAGLASTELERFKRDYDLNPVPRSQEVRAGTIAWLAVTLPEAFDGQWVDEVQTLILKLEYPNDASSWYRLPALRSAIALLNNAPELLDRVIADIDHHNSGLRAYILESIAFSAPLLSFDCIDLRDRVESVFRLHLTGWDEAVLVLLAARGNGVDKIEWARRWAPEVESAQDGILTDIANGSPTPNVLFERGLAQIERYAFASLLGRLGESVPSSVERIPGAEPVFARMIRDRLDDHPLMNPTFRITA